METIKINQEDWILMNAMKGNEIIYIPQKKRYYAKASGLYFSGDAIRRLVADGYIEARSTAVSYDGFMATIPVYFLTSEGIRLWESVSGGIETIYSECEECHRITYLRGILNKTIGRFSYCCIHCRSGEITDGT